MYGLQLDQLAVLLGRTDRQARAVVTRWARHGPGRIGDPRSRTALGLAHQGRADGLRCSVRSGPARTRATRAHPRGHRDPAHPGSRTRLPRRRRTLAQRTSSACPARRAARRARSPARRRGALARGSRGRPPPAWAGECWAIEAELTPKTVARTTAIMRELLTRTGDYGCLAADARVPGLPPRHARVIYLCSPAAVGTAERARDALGSLAARIEIRGLPATAPLRSQPGHRHEAARPRPPSAGAISRRWQPSGSCPSPSSRRSASRSRRVAAGSRAGYIAPPHGACR